MPLLFRHHATTHRQMRNQKYSRTVFALLYILRRRCCQSIQEVPGSRRLNVTVFLLSVGEMRRLGTGDR